MKAWAIKKGTKYYAGEGLGVNSEFGGLIKAELFQYKKYVIGKYDLLPGEKVVQIEMKEVIT